MFEQFKASKAYTVIKNIAIVIGAYFASFFASMIIILMLGLSDYMDRVIKDFAFAFFFYFIAYYYNKKYFYFLSFVCILLVSMELASISMYQGK